MIGREGSFCNLITFENDASGGLEFVIATPTEEVTLSQISDCLHRIWISEEPSFECFQWEKDWRLLSVLLRETDQVSRFLLLPGDMCFDHSPNYPPNRLWVL